MDTLTRIIKKNTKNQSSLNRYELLEQIGNDTKKWCKRYKNTDRFKTEIEKLENISSDELLEEIDKIIIQKMDDELNRRKEPRLYEGHRDT